MKQKFWQIVRVIGVVNLVAFLAFRAYFWATEDAAPVLAAASNPPTVTEAAKSGVFGDARALEAAKVVEITLNDRVSLSPLSYLRVAKAAFSYGKFAKESGLKPKNLIIYHYAMVTDIYGNRREERTGSLRWAARDIERLNYDLGDHHTMLNLARINDLLLSGQMSVRALCKKSYAGLFSGFCNRLRIR